MSQSTAKQRALEAVQNLPENASIEDAIERLLFLAKVQRGLDQAARGETVSHADAKARLLK